MTLTVAGRGRTAVAFIHSLVVTGALAAALGLAGPVLAKDGGGGADRGGADRGGPDRGGPDRGTGGEASAAGRDAGSADRSSGDRGNGGRGSADRSGGDRGNAAGSSGRGSLNADRQAERGNLAAALGALNAAHASPVARERAAAGSQVGQIAAYEQAMRGALALPDPVARAIAVADARTSLEGAANKSLSPAAIAQVDAMLGLQSVDPDAGTGAPAP